MNIYSTTKRNLLFLVVCTVAALLASLGQRLVPESTPFARGAVNGNNGSCNSCHGQTEIGYPDDSSLHCGNAGANNRHPQYEGDCADLLSYFEMVRLKRSFLFRSTVPVQNRLLQGESLARQYHCFHCHGELGQGGFLNDGALKGYIPGYFGNDFALLTRDGSPESVMAWLSLGLDPDLFSNPVKGPVARYFIERQDVGMPNFRTIPETQRLILTDYVVTLSQFGKMDAKAIRAYSQLTQLPLVENMHEMANQRETHIREPITK